MHTYRKRLKERFMCIEDFKQNDFYSKTIKVLQEHALYNEGHEIMIDYSFHYDMNTVTVLYDDKIFEGSSFDHPNENSDVDLGLSVAMQRALDFCYKFIQYEHLAKAKHDINQILTYSLITMIAIITAMIFFISLILVKMFYD